MRRKLLIRSEFFGKSFVKVEYFFNLKQILSGGFYQIRKSIKFVHLLKTNLIKN